MGKETQRIFVILYLISAISVNLSHTLMLILTFFLLLFHFSLLILFSFYYFFLKNNRERRRGDFSRQSRIYFIPISTRKNWDISMLIFGSVTLSLRGFVLKSFAELDNDFLLMAGPSTRHFYSISQPFFMWKLVKAMKIYL